MSGADGARVRFARGGEARIASIGPDTIVLRSTFPAPPGARLEGVVHTDGVVLALRMKVHSARRVGEGEFVLTGRPLDLAREVRLQLERACLLAEDGLAFNR
jgi:hypothetical protein